MNTSQLTITQLASTINAHMGKAHQYADKAEQHFKAMGIHLIEAKHRIANGEYEGGFVAFLNAECKGLSKSRAYELIAIGNGSKTVAEGRKVKAAGMQKVRLAIRHVVDSDAKTNTAGDPRSQEKHWEDIGQALLEIARQNPDPVDFHEWLDSNGFPEMSDEQRVGTMFVTKRQAGLKELMEGLKSGETAGTAYMKFLENMFDDPITAGFNSDISASANYLHAGMLRTHKASAEELLVAAEVAMGPNRAAHVRSLERLTKKMAKDGMDGGDIRLVLHQAMTSIKNV